MQRVVIIIKKNNVNRSVKYKVQEAPRYPARNYILPYESNSEL